MVVELILLLFPLTQAQLPYFSLDKNFHLGWQFSQSNITFTFNVLSTQCFSIYSWCGISFVHGMENTELIVMLNQANTISVTDYYSTAFQKPTQTTSTPFTIISAVANSTGIFGTFSRALTPSSPLSQPLYAGFTTDFGYAYLTSPNKGLAAHNYQGIGLVTFGATNATSKYVPNGTNVPYLSLDSNFQIGWQFSTFTIEFTFNV
jgi:hypothetical protein